MKEIKCKYCHQVTEPILIKKATSNINAQHVGVHCRLCKRWLKWAKKDEISIWDVNHENQLF